MSLFRSAATIGVFTLMSRVLGFLRDICIASFVGANAMTDAFFVAFKLPNFMRRLFAEGAFNSAFVPLYAGTLASDGKPAAQKLAGESLAVLLCILVVLTIVVEIFMPQIMLVLAPGFGNDPDKFDLAVALTRITFPYIIFISLVSLLGGVLNSSDKFAAVAASPILLNIALITSIIAFRDAFPTPAHALSWGVVVAGVMQLLWLILFCKRYNILPPLSRPALTKNVKKLLVLIGPAALGAGVAQVNLMIDMIIASSVPEGVSYLYYADRINQLPLGVIGVGVGTALLPMLSKQLRESDKSKALYTQNRAIELVLLLAMPAAAAILIIAQPMISTLFEHGAFTADATRATYPALMAYGLGLPAFVLIKVLAPGFYANQDTKTPFQIAGVCMILNLVLNLALVGPMQHVGLALATTVAGWVNVLLMAWILNKRGLMVIDARLRTRVPRIVLSCAIMASVLYGAHNLLIHVFNETLLYRALALAAIIGSGIMVYGFCVLSFKVIMVDEFKAMFSRRKVAVIADNTTSEN
ncbi:MAG: murein biosynthesis integral membrane protein MurJ [Alphaproteobacteria bacterium]|nr:murein biosynthesis integral membrane protein MurJ [Alphaproteobacteria bacterium]